jgi:heterodisulfide reductase subunit C
VIISADCTDPYETCCCTLLGNKPHVESGYDLNISKVEGGFIVEPGSEFGKKLLQEHSSLFRTATAEMISARAATRDATTRKVEAINREMGLTRRRQEIIRSAPGDPAWYPHVRTCVECAACLFSCPTCHCFLLYDQKGRQAFERAKAWDVCIYAGYSRMAGGGSPRPFVVERFRHRFRHKYDQIVERYGMEGCSGCGRCIEGCPGLIDFRKVFRALDRMKPAQTATKAARI